jgi:DNA repair ATPase RecN
MKALKLTIKNVGLVEDAVIELNKPLLCFYGEIRQGKTTLLNAVKWVFGGTFPSDIIRRGETEALIRMDLDTGAVQRTFYVAKDGSTKARALVFEKNGTPVRDAVAEVKKMLNPFLLDQNHLSAMTELERKKYFASVFAVDTAGLDAEILATEEKASRARETLKAYGEIDLTEVAKPEDLMTLQVQRAEIVRLHIESQAALHVELANLRQGYQSKLDAANAENRLIRDLNAKVDTAEGNVRVYKEQITRLQRELEIQQTSLKETENWLAAYQRKDEVPAPGLPDTTALEARISNTADTATVDAALSKRQAEQVLYDQYVKNQTRQKEREADEALILSLEATTRELRNKRLAKLKTCGESSGIPGLAFDGAGNFSYEGCEAGMLSTSQLMKLSSQLSSLYPPGFGIELLDRAESLGRSVFDFIEQAKSQNKTILAAIVGEKPAMVPADVGVFVVEGGSVKAA